MANENEKVIFGAEFQGDGVTKGVDALVQNLEKMKEVQKDLKTELAATTAELKKNEKALKDKEDALNKAINTEGEYAIQLKNQIAALKQRNDVLADSSKRLTGFLNSQNKEIKDQNKVLSDNRREHEVLGKAVEKLTSVNHIAAEGVGLFRRQVVDTGFAMVSGFAGGIVASVLPALASFVEGLFDSSKELDELKKKQQVLNDINVAAVDIYAGQVTRLELLRAKITDTNIPLAERLRLVDEYNKIADKGNQIDKTQIGNLDVINSQITKQIELIKQRAIARAAENVIAQKAEALIKSQFAAQKEFPKVFDQLFDPQQEQFDLLRKNNIPNNGDFQSRLFELTFKNPKAFDKSQILQAIRDSKEDFDRTVEAGLSLINTEALTTKPGKDKAEKKAPENVFQQLLASLRARLAASADKEFQSEPLIEDKFDAQLDKEFANIAKLLKDKKLTDDQAAILKALIKQINDIDLEKEITEFRNKQREALKKINDAIESAAIEDANKRVANIRNEFEREKAAIEEGYQATVSGLATKLRDLIDQVNKDVAKGLISKADGKQKKTLLSLLFGDLIDQAGRDETNKQLDLSFKTFQKSFKDAGVLFDQLNLKNDQDTAADIQRQKKLFEAGSISYETFQKRLTKILKDQKTERDRLKLLELNTDLKVIQDRLKATNDPDQQKSLQDQELKIKSDIAKVESDVDKTDPNKKRAEEIKKYVAALTGLLSSVISFWQQVNQVEAAALDRSIALQDKRVENARLIAEKGNAEYLEMEQKRLDELTQKREENARKQLAINNALTLSQATVAAISAIASAAQSGSPFAAIAAVAAVIGAIAAAYSFVNSLQPQNASFYEGTEYVSGAGVPAGRDKVKANLHVGERVTTANDNRAYWNTLSAIHNHRIPPEALNSFVTNYQNGVPAVDYGRLMGATNFRSGFDSVETASKLDRLNESMEFVGQALATLGINVNLDEHGFSASLQTYIRKQKLRNKS